MIVNSSPSRYQVIARKYRPQTFGSVVGQEAVVTTLKNALRMGRLAHAYLFCGCRGTGKTTLARVFAKALNCQRLTEDQEPCNACPSCQEVMSGRSLDVLEIDGASNRGIDDIRQINETIGYAPASGKFKIYIIDEVHMLTKEAFNALLKTLEEPPPNVKFFFATTEPHKVLPTILSRCQRFDLNRISRETMVAKLRYITQDLNVLCDPEALALISDLSEGCLRDAESLLDQVICYAEAPITLDKVSSTLGLMPRTTFFDLDAAISQQQLNFPFEIADALFSTGKDLGHFLDHLLEHFRTHLHCKLGRSPEVFDPEEKKRYLAHASLYTEEQLLGILDYLIHWQQQLAKTPFKRIALEMILLHLVRSKHRITLAALTKRLIDLEKTLSNPSPCNAERPPEPQVTNETVCKVVTPQPPDSPLIAEELPPAIETQPEPGTSFEQTLLNKIKEKVEQAPPLVQEKIPEKEDIEPVVASIKKAPPGRYETLVRFAAVELEGIIKK